MADHEEADTKVNNRLRVRSVKRRESKVDLQSLENAVR
jgi:hypothetical protein